VQFAHNAHTIREGTIYCTRPFSQRGTNKYNACSRFAMNIYATNSLKEMTW